MVFSWICLIHFFILVLLPYVASITFDLTVIDPENALDITCSQEAYISKRGLQMTPNEKNANMTSTAGRATYKQPLHLWSNESGEVASFSTNFTFEIDSDDSSNYADGLTFFLAEDNSFISTGGAMGLPMEPGTNQAINRFVAVEFDTYWNGQWDPKPNIGDHVGISISSLASVRYQKWFSDVFGGSLCEAWVTYDSISKNLSVSFTNFKNKQTVRQDGLFAIVDLKDELPESVILGFSAATGDWFQRNTVKSWSFRSSILQIDKNSKAQSIPSPSPQPLNPSPQLVNKSPQPVNPSSPPVNQSPPQVNPIPQPVNPSPQPVNPRLQTVNGKNKKAQLLKVGLSVVIIFLAMLAFALGMRMKRQEVEPAKSFDVELNSEFKMGTGSKPFSYRELARATSNFARNQKLGQGGFGPVYRGFLKDSSTYVAVKKVSKTSKQGIKEYASEVRIVSRLRHKNLVQLRGWCHKNGKLLLVYEYLENGSLDLHLFKGKSLLTWETRYNIARGLAYALLYLHEELDQCVLHRDIKSSNVMLDSNFCAKLGDFGLAKLVDHDKGLTTTMRLVGTMGYMAPEYGVSGRATKESDVYSFGVVTLEIACGRRTIDDKVDETKRMLIEWVWELYGTGKLLEAVDPLLGLAFDEEKIKLLMIVGLWCVHPDSQCRPTMRQVIQILNFEASLPKLPSKMPVASYLTTPMPSLIHGVASIIQNQSSSMDSIEQPTSSTNSTTSSSSFSMQ